MEWNKLPNGFGYQKIWLKWSILYIFYQYCLFWQFWFTALKLSQTRRSNSSYEAPKCDKGGIQWFRCWNLRGEDNLWLCCYWRMSGVCIYISTRPVREAEPLNWPVHWNSTKLNEWIPSWVEVVCIILLQFLSWQRLIHSQVLMKCSSPVKNFLTSLALCFPPHCHDTSVAQVLFFQDRALLPAVNGRIPRLLKLSLTSWSGTILLGSCNRIFMTLSHQVFFHNLWRQTPPEGA